MIHTRLATQDRYINVIWQLVSICQSPSITRKLNQQYWPKKWDDTKTLCPQNGNRSPIQIRQIKQYFILITSIPNDHSNTWHGIRTHDRSVINFAVNIDKRTDRDKSTAYIITIWPFSLYKYALAGGGGEP